jgi:predicted DNA-binding protein
MSSYRLQVLIPESLDRRIRKAAQRSRQSAGAWVREAIELHLAGGRPATDALEHLQALGAPTGDIDQMLAEIEAGRG